MTLKLKLQYFGHLMPRVDSLEKTLMLGGIGGRRRRGRQRRDGWMASLTRWTWVWVNSGSWWWTGRPCVLRFMGLQRVGHDWATELNWTELKSLQSCLSLSDSMDYSPPGSSAHGDSPSKNTEVGCYALLQEIFPTQGSNAGLRFCRKILYCLSH